MEAVIYETQKSKYQKLRVILSKYAGQHVLDIRTWFPPPPNNPDGDWYPTRKGITIRLDQIADLKNAIFQAEKIILENHLI